jgi:hypothetical protein
LDKVRIEQGNDGRPQVVYTASGDQEAAEARDMLDTAIAGQSRGPLAKLNAWLDRVSRGFGQTADVLGRWLAPMLAIMLTVLACLIAWRAWSYALPGVPFVSWLGLVITLGLVWASVRAKREALDGDAKQATAFGVIVVLLLAANMAASTSLQSAMTIRQDDAYQAIERRIEAWQRELRTLQARQAVAPLDTVETLERKAEAFAIRQASAQQQCEAPRASRAACVQAQELAALTSEAQAEVAAAQGYISTQARILELEFDIARAEATRPAPAGLAELAREIGADQKLTAYGMPVLVTLVVDILAAALCMAAFGTRRRRVVQ